MPDLTEQQLLATDPEVMGLQYKRQLANLLTSQGLNQPQGQMISGHYVPPSKLQNALPLIQAAIGGFTSSNLDTEQQRIAKLLKQRQVSEAQNIMSAGSPEAKIQAALGGTTNLSSRLATKLLENYTNPIYEKADINVDGKIVKGVYDTRNPDVMATFKPYNESKDIPLATAQYSGVIPQGTPQNSLNFANQVPGAGLPTLNNVKPNAQPGAALPMPQTEVLGKTKYDLEIPKQFNTPKERDEWMAKSREPLSAEPLKIVNGAENTIKTLRDYNNAIQTFRKEDMLSPDKSAAMLGLTKNAILSLKDAKGLGVLNVHDLPQLEAILRDPSDWKNLLNSKELFQKLANNQIDYAGSVIATNYKNSYKQMPDEKKALLLQIDAEKEQQKKAPKANLDKPIMYNSQAAVEAAGKAGQIEDGQIVIIGNQKFKWSSK
jgi:hypothetical protein